MSVSVYSIIMAILWFTLAVLIGNYTLHRASKHGLFFVASILLLSALRIFLPLDLNHSIVIRSVRLYPFLQNLMRYVLIGHVTIGNSLIVCWIIGACICFALLLRKLLLQRKFRKAVQCQQIDSDLLGLLYEISREMGYCGPVELAISTKATTAYQAGFLFPYIVLPHNIDEFSVTDIRNMFRHELCHFLGGDLWLQIGLQIMSCILWWNPAVILFRRNVEQMLELRCDRRACASLTSEAQVSYLDTLLRLLSDNRPKVFKVSLDYSGGADEAEILQRFQMILQGETKTLSKIRTAAGCLMCIALFVVSYCMILQPWTAPTDEQTEIYHEVVMVPEESYILRELDGTLLFYCNNINYGEIPETLLEYEPFSKLHIYERTSLS